MPKNSHISVLSASIQGALHKAKGLACQDYSCHKIKGKKLVAVISDGAGSAKYGKIGARIICKTLCDVLLSANISNIEQNIVKAIDIARDKLIIHPLNRHKSPKDLLDFSATIVGAFCHAGKGVFFHIGDGAALAFNHNNYADFVISEPENGAFACETYFYTMPDWQDWLRIKKFEKIDRILLMTDGVTCFAFDEYSALRNNFVLPIVQYLEKEEQKNTALQALQNTLNNKKAQHINADDKTILWAKIR